MSYQWDVAQNEQLKQLVAEKIPYAKIGEIMGKSHRAIKARVARAGLSKPASGRGRWSRDEDTLLGHLYCDGTPRKRMATLLGRTIEAIRSRLNHLGYVQNDKGRPGAEVDSSCPRAVVEMTQKQPPPIDVLNCPWEMWSRAMNNVRAGRGAS